MGVVDGMTGRDDADVSGVPVLELFTIIILH